MKKQKRVILNQNLGLETELIKKRRRKVGITVKAGQDQKDIMQENITIMIEMIEAMIGEMIEEDMIEGEETMEEEGEIKEETMRKEEGAEIEGREVIEIGIIKTDLIGISMMTESRKMQIGLEEMELEILKRRQEEEDKPQKKEEP